MSNGNKRWKLLFGMALLFGTATVNAQGEIRDGQTVAARWGGKYANAKILFIPEKEFLHLLVSENSTDVVSDIYLQHPANFLPKQVFEKAQLVYLKGIVIVNNPATNSRYIFRVDNDQAKDVYFNLPADYISGATIVNAAGIGFVPDLKIPVETFGKADPPFAVIYKK